ncbi:MAG: hypothetical protein CME62_00780 [Halobacteriovoraceae bacterium]|nr:hypothetical protein [Halobacteriovoraceae bacterium]|tara:strand:+ start:2813 stop:3454 length:642 start_codon:yes stop_codon:yes gene_type:complete
MFKLLLFLVLFSCAHKTNEYIKRKKLDVPEEGIAFKKEEPGIYHFDIIVKEKTSKYLISDYIYHTLNVLCFDSGFNFMSAVKTPVKIINIEGLKFKQLQARGFCYPENKRKVININFVNQKNNIMEVDKVNIPSLVKPGDILLTFNGKQIKNLLELRKLIFKLGDDISKNGTISLGVKRGDKELILEHPIMILNDLEAFSQYYYDLYKEKVMN